MINLGELILIYIGIIIFIYYNTCFDNTDNKIIRFTILLNIILFIIELGFEILSVRYKESYSNYKILSIENLDFLKGNKKGNKFNDSMLFDIFSTHPLFFGF